MIGQTYTQIQDGKLVRQNFGLGALVGNYKKTPRPPSFLTMQGVQKNMGKNISGPESVKLKRTREAGSGWVP
jgi:hypothetical protein